MAVTEDSPTVDRADGVATITFTPGRGFELVLPPYGDGVHNGTAALIGVHKMIGNESFVRAMVEIAEEIGEEIQAGA